MKRFLLLFLFIFLLSAVNVQARRGPWIDGKTLYTHEKVKLYEKPGEREVMVKLEENVPVTVKKRAGNWLLVEGKINRRKKATGWAPFFRFTPCRPIKVRKATFKSYGRGKSYGKYVARIRDFEGELPGKTLLFRGEVGKLRKSLKEGGW